MKIYFLKKFLALVIISCALVALSSCAVENKDAPIKEQTVAINDQEQNIVRDLLESLTIEQKAAQMLIISYSGTEITKELEALMKMQPGGIILFANNFTIYDETYSFINQLKSMSNIPLIISTDQEGGMVQRLKEPLAFNIPDMYTVGKTNDKQLAYNVGKVMAEQMRVFGINVTFAPVLDVYSNSNNTVIGRRSFSNDSYIVSEMALSLALGLQDNGVTATFKHFPGHGDTSIDSHYSLPVINKSKEELYKTELIPFKNAIENNARIVMVGHIALPKVTGNDLPASLSKEIITDLLKTEMGYKGLVITDALNMGAITNNYGETTVYEMAINAGVDLLLMPSDYKAAIDYIVNNVSEERINESVYKILEFKLKYLSEENILDSSYLKSGEHKQVIDSIN